MRKNGVKIRLKSSSGKPGRVTATVGGLRMLSGTCDAASGFSPVCGAVYQKYVVTILGGPGVSSTIVVRSRTSAASSSGTIPHIGSGAATMTPDAAD